MDWTPIITALITGAFGIGIAWFVRGRVEEWTNIREALRAERRERYAQVINPYVQLWADTSRSKEVEDIMKSAEYRKEVFDLVVIAEDEVIRAYNQMFDDFGRAGTSGSTSEQVQSLRSFARLILSIRRSLGNRKTQLDDVAVLKALGVRDAERMFSGRGPHKQISPGGKKGGD